MADNDEVITLMSDDDRDGVPSKMAVEELIALLQQYPKESTVDVGGYSGFGALVLYTETPT